MRQPEFDMERWQSRFENTVRCNLSDSGVLPFRFAEFCEFANVDPGDVMLGYGPTEGTAELRARVASLYPEATADDVLITTGSAEANFLAMWRLVEPGDRVVIVQPTYGQTVGRANGLGANVTVMDVDIDRLRYLDDVMPPNVHTVFSDRLMLQKYLITADLVIGAVLIPGARCPVLVPREWLSLMKPGSVIVDVGVDQGGCVETIRPTTHDDPTYIVDNVVHYGVTNMPGAVGRTSTFALSNATLPYVLKLADAGYREACSRDPGLAAGINIENGKVTNRAVDETFGLEFTNSSAAA